jgi:hypothetical protein
MPRRARVDAPGTRHHVIVRGTEKRLIVNDDLSKLDDYFWSGHSAMVGRVEYNLQDTAYALKWFGERMKQARQDCRQFVEEGIALGRQPHLVGGGLIRSAGGWSEVKTLRRIGMQEKSDERILGSGPFVAQVLDEA